jgi:hypothetical protein
MELLAIVELIERSPPLTLEKVPLSGVRNEPSQTHKTTLGVFRVAGFIDICRQHQ